VNSQESSSNKPEGPQGTMLFRSGDIPSVDPAVQNLTITPDSPALVGLAKPFEGQRFNLRAGRTTMGRSANNDLTLAEPSISATHARIIGERGNWRILNLLSTNGTFVNGRKVSESPLQHGDRIRMGRVEFVFQTSEKLDPSRVSRRSRSVLVLVTLAILAVAAAVAFVML